MIGPHDHHRTDTVSPKLLRWLSTGSAVVPALDVRFQSKLTVIKSSQITLIPGGELLIIAKPIVKQLRMDHVNRRLLTLPVHQIRGMFQLLYCLWLDVPFDTKLPVRNVEPGVLLQLSKWTRIHFPLECTAWCSLLH